MGIRLTDLPDALRDEGVEPVVVDGFRSRGSDFPAQPKLHLVHWTAGPRLGRTPSLGTVTNGRPDLPYNLCTVLQSREGGTRPDKAYCVSSGRAVHAGEGVWEGVTSGNSNGTGNEIEWSGPGEPFPNNRYETTLRIAAAHVKLQRSQSKYVCNHREYATPPGRKIDTNLDGDKLRRGVQTLLDQGDDDMFDGDDKLRLAACTQILADLRPLVEALVPRPPTRVATSGPNIGQPDPDGKLAADVWRWTLYMELERQGRSTVFADAIATAVVARLPAAGGPPASDELSRIVREAVNAELGFLKPGQ